MNEKAARLIAYYLPQFHPIPENDAWWGKGFTEWTNVAKAKPMFRGHYQPHVPADLGFYDLRLPEVRAAQAQIAMEHGVEAFCYWHYWFGGKRLLERPMEEILQSGEPDFPFCLAWANQGWSGIWHGAPDRILIDQTYPGMDDHKAHFSWMLRAFQDPRYLTVDGKPIFLIYQPLEIPQVKNVLELWRELAHKAGLKGLHLVGMNIDSLVASPEMGFDAYTYARHRSVADFAPKPFPVRILRKLRKRPVHVYSYREAMKYFIKDFDPLSPVDDYHTIVTGWDTTPRCNKDGVVLTGYTPDLFRSHVREVLAEVAEKPLEHRIVFVRSWNEWAEGNHIEPDLRYGSAFLHVLKEEVHDYRPDRVPTENTNEKSLPYFRISKRSNGMTLGTPKRPRTGGSFTLPPFYGSGAKIKENIRRCLSSFGFSFNKYDRLLMRMKDRYRSSRCVILGRGAALGEFPLRDYEGDFVIASDCVLLHPEVDRLSKGFYCVSDSRVWGEGRGQKQEFISALCRIPKLHKMFGFAARCMLNGNGNKTSAIFRVVNRERRVWRGDLELDIRKEFSWGDHVVLDMCFPIALFLGFSSIVAAGCSWNWEIEKPIVEEFHQRFSFNDEESKIRFPEYMGMIRREDIWNRGYSMMLQACKREKIVIEQHRYKF
jgi:hypothetical protein